MGFVDSNGVQWLVKITGADVQRVAAECNIDLGNPVDAVQKAATSTPVLLNLLFCLARNANGERPTKPDTFAEGFSGATVEEGQEALVGAIQDFFHGTRTGEKLSAVLGKAKQLAAEIQTRAEKDLASVDMTKLAASLFASSGSLAGKPELTPGA